MPPGFKALMALSKILRFSASFSKKPIAPPPKPRITLNSSEYSISRTFPCMKVAFKALFSAEWMASSIYAFIISTPTTEKPRRANASECRPHPQAKSRILSVPVSFNALIIKFTSFSVSSAHAWFFISNDHPYSYQSDRTIKITSLP